MAIMGPKPDDAVVIVYRLGGAPCNLSIILTYLDHVLVP